MSQSLNQQIKNYVQYTCTRSLLCVLSIFPLRTRRKIADALLRFVGKRLKRHRNIAHRNIALAFPEWGEAERQKIFLNSFASMGNLIIDVARFPLLTKQWSESHINFPNLERLKAVKRSAPEKGILLVTGHLGSFELSAFCLPFLYRPISFLIRGFSNPYLDKWWTKRRERNGNRVVSREGGYREMVKLLRSGMDVGVLFDQNVTRNHALFIDWFGRPAATTKALALAALKTHASVFIVAIILKEADQYHYECIECNCSDIYEDSSITKGEKLVQITKRLVHEYEKLIIKYPDSWFWIHRKWRTAPTDISENFYDGC